jgi:(2S)-methylsuccinyl-CoA dehydrogenase
MATRTNAARQLSYHAARLLASGRGQTETSLAKLYASRMAELVAREAMQLHGGMGYAEETEVSRFFVDARVLAIFEGAEEVLSLRVIGRALLQS